MRQLIVGRYHLVWTVQNMITSLDSRGTHILTSLVPRPSTLLGNETILTQQAFVQRGGYTGISTPQHTRVPLPPPEFIKARCIIITFKRGMKLTCSGCEHKCLVAIAKTHQIQPYKGSVDCMHTHNHDHHMYTT